MVDRSCTNCRLMLRYSPSKLLLCSGRVIPRGRIDLSFRHLTRNVPHLLVDVVTPRTAHEGGQLVANVSGGFALEPGRA
jgi:hypothetical protein